MNAVGPGVVPGVVESPDLGLDLKAGLQYAEVEEELGAVVVVATVVVDAPVPRVPFCARGQNP